MTPIEIDQKVFKPLLRRAVLLPLLALAGLCAVLIWQIVQMEKLDRWVDHTDQVMATAQQELQLLVDRETATRGYALSGNPLFLQPEYLGREKAPRVLAQLKQLIADNPEQQTRLGEIEELIRQWEPVRDAAEKQRQTAGAPGMDTLISGKLLLDRVRDKFSEFMAVEQSLRIERMGSATEARHLALLSALGLTLLIAGGLAFSSRKQLEKLSRNYSEALLTSHQRTQDLALLNERFTATLKGIGDGVLATDERGYIVFMNAVAEELSGWKAEDAKGRPAHEIFHIVNQETRAVVESPVERALRSGEISLLANHTILLAKDGREIHIDDSGAPIRNEHGKIIGAVLVFRDVGDRRTLEMTRDSALQELKAILEATPDGVYKLDAQGRVQFTNGVGAAMLGYTPAEIQGQLMHDISHHSHEDGSRFPWEDCPIRQAALSGNAVSSVNDVFWRRDRTSLPVQYSATPVTGPAGKSGVAVVFKDMTGARRSEQALLRSEKLAATGQMASAMAHEINNPLEAITNLLYLLDYHVTDQPQAKAYVHLADQELKRVVHIVQRTLGLYRESAQEREVSVGALCNEVGDFYKNTIEFKQIRFSHDCEGDARILGYANEVRHVLSNVLANAVEAAPQGGAVRMRVRRTIVGGVEGACIIISDNGPGIAKEARHQIYDAFYTTKNGSGSGIGLWIVRSVVDRMGGTIQVRTRTGSDSYTAFRMFLPANHGLMTHTAAAGSIH